MIYYLKIKSFRAYNKPVYIQTVQGQQLIHDVILMQLLFSVIFYIILTAECLPFIAFIEWFEKANSMMDIEKSGL